MDLQVMVEKLVGGGYRATVTTPMSAVVEAPTRGEALQQIKRVIGDKLRSGTEIVRITVPGTGNPWLDNAGTFDADDPDFKEWMAIIEENRRAEDQGSKLEAS